MYLNTLICLEENVGGYGKNQRRPSGHVTISTPGIIKCYVQDLIGLTDKKYVLYVVSKKNNKAIRIGELNDPCQNKQSTWKVEIENIEGSTISGKDIDAAAVVVEGDMIGSTDSVLVGYCKDKYLITSMLEQSLPKKAKPQPTPAQNVIKVDAQTASMKVKVPGETKPVAPIMPVAEVKPVAEIKPVVEVKPILQTKPVVEIKPVMSAPTFNIDNMEEEEAEYIDQVDLKGNVQPSDSKPVIFYTTQGDSKKEDNKLEEQLKALENDPAMQKVKEALLAQIKEQMQMQDQEQKKEMAKEEKKIDEKEQKAMEEKEKKKMSKDKREDYLGELGIDSEQTLGQSVEETKFLDEISQRLRNMQSSGASSETKPSEKFKEIREIFDRSEPIEVFDQEEDSIEWVRISMDELTAIPQLDYEWCTQPMIIFCYHKFSHFVLGKDKAMEAYYIGIPDIYHTTRRYILNYERIERFKTSSGSPISNGEYGYWIARIE